MKFSKRKDSFGYDLNSLRLFTNYRPNKLKMFPIYILIAFECEFVTPADSFKAPRACGANCLGFNSDVVRTTHFRNSTHRADRQLYASSAFLNNPKG